MFRCVNEAGQHEARTKPDAVLPEPDHYTPLARPYQLRDVPQRGQLGFICDWTRWSSCILENRALRMEQGSLRRDCLQISTKVYIKPLGISSTPSALGNEGADHLSPARPPRDFAG